MSDKARAHTKLGELIEAAEAIDGINVEKTSIDELPVGGANMLQQMFGGGPTPEPETQTAITLVATLDDEGPKQEKPDDHDPDDAVEIEFDADEPEASPDA